MRNGHIVALAALLFHSSVIAQNSANQSTARVPELTARQLEASRALVDMTRPAAPMPGPNLLVEPKDRQISLGSAHYDPTVPTTTEGQLRQSSCAAEVVVVGTVLELSPFLNEDASFILTEYTIKVEETLRGRPIPPGSTISYVRSGGSMNIGGRIVSASHNLYPPLLRGQKYVLFLAKTRPGSNLQMPIARAVDALLEGQTSRGLGARPVPDLKAGLQPGHLRQLVASAKCQG